MRLPTAGEAGNGPETQHPIGPVFPGAGRCAWLRAGSSERGQHCSRGAASPPPPRPPCGGLTGRWFSGRQVPAATAQAGSSTGSERLRCGCRTCPLPHRQGGPGAGRGPGDREGLLHRPLHPPLPLRGREGAARIGVTLSSSWALPAPHVSAVLRGGPPSSSRPQMRSAFSHAAQIPEVGFTQRRSPNSTRGASDPEASMQPCGHPHIHTWKPRPPT